MVALAVFSGCGGSDDASGPVDPLTRPAPVVSGVTTAASGTVDGRAWSVGISDECVVVTVDDAATFCQYIGDPTSGMIGAGGGIHETVSVGWLTIADENARTAEFVLLDGTVVRGDPVPGLVAPTRAWVLVVPADNEIVGVEALDADRALIVSLPIGDT
jgi:hypothetical protein